MRMKKKIFIIIMSLVMVMSTTITNKAEIIKYKKYKDFKYTTFDYKSVGIYYYVGKKKKVIVPTKIKGKKVVSVSLIRAKNLKQIKIPRYVKYIDLAGNKSLVKVTISKKNKYLSVTNNMVLNKKKTKLISVLGGYEEIRVPKTVKTLAGYAFDRSKVTRIIMTDNVKVIKSSAFGESKKLKEMIFKGNHIPKIEERALGYTKDIIFHVKNKELAEKLLTELRGKDSLYAHIYVGNELLYEEQIDHSY
jgi:hypothetical protein